MKPSLPALLLLTALTTAAHAAEIPPTHTFVSPQAPINSLFISADSTTLAAASQDGRVYVWNLANPAAPRILAPSKASGAMYNVTLSADGTIALAANSGELTAWSLPSGESLVSLALWPIHNPTLRPDGKQFAYATSDAKKSTLILNALPKPALPLQADLPADALKIAYSPDNKTLAVLTGKRFTPANTLSLFSSENLSPLATFTYSGKSGVHSLAFSPDSKQLLLAGEEDRELYDLASSKKIATLTRENKSPVSRDSGAVWFNNSKSIALHNTLAKALLIHPETGKPQRSFEIDADLESAELTISPNGKYLVSAVAGRFVKVWDIPALPPLVAAALQTPKTTFTRHGGKTEVPFASFLNDKNQLVLQGHQGRITSQSFSPDGSTLYSTASDGSLIAWNTSTGKILYTVQTNSGVLSRVVVVNNGKSLLLSPDSTLLNASDGTPAAGSLGDSQLSELTATPNGSRVAGIEDGLTAGVAVWNVAPPKKIGIFRTEEIISNIQLSADGNTLAFSFDDALHVFSVTTQKSLLKLKKDLGTFALSPDAQSLASSTFNKITLLDIPSQKELRIINVDGATILAFSTDSKSLAVHSPRKGKAWLLNPADGALRELPLVDPGISTGSDVPPAFSPDNSTLSLPYLDRITLLKTAPN